jgi:formate dehydrogenase accessory protein FdhE
MPRSQAIDPRWAPRAGRARTLLAERPHTEPLLRFYLSLLELQTAVCVPVEVDRWLPVVEASGGADAPILRLERLPLAELFSSFAAFCRGMPETAPEPISQAAHAVSGAGEHVRVDLLLAMLTGADHDAAAGALGCTPAPLAFLSRGFLSPIAEVLAGLVSPAHAAARSPACPRCGWPPQVSRLEDEPEAQGNRRLVCALCASTWTFPRAVCPACGVSGDDGLEFHGDESRAHVRVEACKTCRCYLKSVDLRVLGIAEPLVDDLATVELDLWAADQGLEKIAPNVLGL